MIIYKCTIPASTDLRGPYEDQYVEFKTFYQIPPNVVRRMTIDRVDKKYVSFGHLSYETEVEDL